jgi:hypothetical protein
MKGKKRNNAVWNANSGRKPFSVELAEALATGIANHIHNEELEKLYNKDKRTLDEMKILVTPITTKGIVNKSEISIGARVAGKDLDKLLDYAENEKNRSLSEDKEDERENTNLSGRDIGEQDI